MEVISSIKKNCFLITIVLLSFVLRMLWLRSPIQGDEGFYAYRAWLWLQGFDPYTYGINLQPPLLYLTYALPIRFFGNNILPIRMMNNILFLASIIFLYLLVKNWYDKKTGLISAFVYGVFMNAPIFLNQGATSESLSLSFFIISVYLFDRYIRKEDTILMVLSGILFSCALLIRIEYSLGIVLLLTMMVLRGKPGKVFQIKSMLLLAGTIILPILVFVIYFWSNGALGSLVSGVILNKFRPDGYLHLPDVPFGVIFLIFAEGLPLWLFGLFGFIACVLRRVRSDILCIVWSVPFFLRVILIGPHFGHHFTFMIAPVAILASVCLVLILRNAEFGSIPKFLADYEKNFATFFVIALFALSFVPSLYFQAQQYPDVHIHWQFIHRDYGGLPGTWSYDEQLRLSEFLKANTPKNGQILVHSWVAWPYWLSGYRAPSKHLTTVKLDYFTISEEEFQRILGMVRDVSFDSIAIAVGSSNIENLKLRRDDPIINCTFKYYFYLDRIKNAQIFSKYNLAGEYKSYSFVDNWSNAVKEYKLPNGTVSDIGEDFSEIFMPQISKLEIVGSQRDTIRQVPIVLSSRVCYNNVFINKNSKLKFGLGIDPETWKNEGGDGVQFEIYVEHNGITERLLSKYINPKKVVEDRKWHDYQLDLMKYGDKTVKITFVTTPGPLNDTYDDLAHWSDPVILTLDKPMG